MTKKEFEKQTELKPTVVGQVKTLDQQSVQNQLVAIKYHLPFKYITGR